MRPDTPQQPLQDPRGSVPTPIRDSARHQQAVANMTRGQIAAIYSKQSDEGGAELHDMDGGSEQQHTPAVIDKHDSDIDTGLLSADDQPDAYHRTHTETTHDINAKQWEQYHTEWQKYYQQYYEQYYVGAAKQTHQAYQAHAAQLREQLEKQALANPELTEEQAMDDLKSQLQSKIKHNAKKVRASKHFIPALSALSVLLLFLFLQYNSMLLAYAQAYISPGNMDPQNIIVDPNASLAVDPAPKLIIPKINVDVPVDYNALPDYDSQMAAMKTSVAYFGIAGANSKPGQLGNTPMAGHSSNDFTDSGAAKFIFARLDQMQKGDIFYLNYGGTRYTYSVSNVMIVLPSEVTKLQIGYDKPYATLITCTPLGTAEKRLLIMGEQISPSPSKASPAPSAAASASQAPAMAGKSPTLIERLFGAR